MRMLEPVVLHGKFDIQEYPKTWATNGARGRAHNIINSLWIDVKTLEGLIAKARETMQDFGRQDPLSYR
jgi:hypothetical protein